MRWCNPGALMGIHQTLRHAGPFTHVAYTNEMTQQAEQHLITGGCVKNCQRLLLFNVFLSMLKTAFFCLF